MARNAPVITTTMQQHYPTMFPSTSLVEENSLSMVDRIQLPDPRSIQLSSLEGRINVEDISEELLAETIALILSEFCSTGSEQPRFPDPRDPAALFFSPYKQKSFTLSFYCRRLIQFNCCSKACFPIAILYLIRLAEKESVFELNDYNVHRLVCTALVLAAKYLDDVSYSNSHYAKVGGIQTGDEMNKLEHHMLKMMDYRLFVSKESYEEVENQILQIAATRM